MQIATFLTIILVVLSVIILTVYVSYFFLFKLIGETPLYAFIPVLNTYIIFRHFWKKKSFIVYILFVILSYITMRVPVNGLRYVLDAGTAVAILSVMGMAMHHVAKAFGYGKLFAVGLTVLPFIFYPVLVIRAWKSGKATNKTKRIAQKAHWRKSG